MRTLKSFMLAQPRRPTRGTMWGCGRRCWSHWQTRLRRSSAGQPTRHALPARDKTWTSRATARQSWTHRQTWGNRSSATPPVPQALPARARDEDPAVHGRQAKYSRVDPPEVEDQPGQAVREDTPGYIVKAFPKLFPHGTGDYHDARPGQRRTLHFEEWGRYVMLWHDGRFMRHTIVS